MRSLFLLAVAALGSAGCAAVGGPPGVRLDPLDASGSNHKPRPSAFSRVGNAVLSVPETAVWWPYKIGTSALRGGYDGMAGGVSRAPMPILGVLAAPLTGAAGIVNGTFHGVGRGPPYVGTTGEFGEALGSTWTEPIPLWNDRR